MGKCKNKWRRKKGTILKEEIPIDFADIERLSNIMRGLRYQEQM